MLRNRESRDKNDEKEFNRETSKHLAILDLSMAIHFIYENHFFTRTWNIPYQILLWFWKTSFFSRHFVVIYLE